MTKVAPWD